MCGCCEIDCDCECDVAACVDPISDACARARAELACGGISLSTREVCCDPCAAIGSVVKNIILWTVACLKCAVSCVRDVVYLPLAIVGWMVLAAVVFVVWASLAHRPLTMQQARDTYYAMRGAVREAENVAKLAREAYGGATSSYTPTASP